MQNAAVFESIRCESEAVAQKLAALSTAVHCKLGQGELAALVLQVLEEADESCADAHARRDDDADAALAPPPPPATKKAAKTKANEEQLEMTTQHTNPLRPLRARLEAGLRHLGRLARQQSGASLAVQKLVAETARSFASMLDEQVSIERDRVTGVLAELRSQLENADARAELAERDAKQLVLKPRLDQLVEEQLARERLMRDQSEQLANDLFQTRESLERLSRDGERDRAAAEEELKQHLGARGDRLEQQLGADTAHLDAQLDQLRLQVQRKTTREDVSRLVLKGIREVSERLKQPDDSLMIGSLNYRCIGCNQTVGNVHAKISDKVVHAGLNPVSKHNTRVSRFFPTTLLQEYYFWGGLFDTWECLRNTHTQVSATLPPTGSRSAESLHSPGEKRAVIQAAYTNSGRGGALRPMRSQGPPGIPISGSRTTLSR